MQKRDTYHEMNDFNPVERKYPIALILKLID
jgi:hypothetical protein